MTKVLRPMRPELGLIVLVGIAFLLGGGARADIASLMLLRPIAILALAFALVRLPRERWRANRGLLACAFALVGLTMLHLVPLPPGLWQALPGRDLAAEIDAAAGLGEIWRPLSLVPWRTLNALFALTLPLAALLLALRLPPERLAPVVYVLLALVLLSATLGLLQVIGGQGNAFYTYRITNAESAVGLFANRNHNAIFLSIGFPLLAAALSLLPVAAEHVRTREWAGAGIGLLIIPFLLTTQSRAGIVLGVVGIALALWVYQSPAPDAQRRRPRRHLDPRLVFGALAGMAVVALTMVFTATNAIERLARFGQTDQELRLQIWPPIARLAVEYLPWGSGIGTFEDVYAVAEPDAQLGPLYTNHAHNDWLEIALTGGLPLLLLVAIAVVVLLRTGLAGLRAARTSREKVLRKLGLSILFVLALASVYDYPLRTPSLAVLFAIGVALWAGRLSQGTWR